MFLPLAFSLLSIFVCRQQLSTYITCLFKIEVMLYIPNTLKTQMTLVHFWFWTGWAVRALITVTGLANFGFTPLLWRPQGPPQGCLEKRNYPLSLNLVVCCAKIQPKTKKVWKTSEMTRKTSKNDGFLTVFQSFLVLGPILAHQTIKFKLSG